MRADVEGSLADLGAELTAHLKPTLTDFVHGELAAVVDLLEQPGGPARLVGATDALRREFVTPQASVAAWEDLVASVRAGQDDESIARRALQLRELEEAQGHEWLWRSRAIRERVSESSTSAVGEFLATPVEPTAQIVWFIFGDADVLDGYLRVGQVRSFPTGSGPKVRATRITSVSFLMAR